MGSNRRSFLNFEVDHMTLLLQPPMYNVAYVVFRTVFGVRKSDLLYEKRKAWVEGGPEESMTFAVQVGEAEASHRSELSRTIMAIVQPTEPKNTSSHVREMLDGHKAASHWQHIALRTPDLLAFHQHAVERGIRFITPILKDDAEDLIQVFSGEWFFPGSPPSGMFFEFLQRNPTPASLQMLADRNRESWFRDNTFLGLYGEKEREYQSKKVTPFIDFDLFDRLQKMVGHKKLWEISEADLEEAEHVMKAYARKHP